MFWLILILYFGGGIVVSGYTYAYFQRQYPRLAPNERSTDGTTALFGIIAGPLSLISLWPLYRSNNLPFLAHGWKLPFSK